MEIIAGFLADMRIIRHQNINQQPGSACIREARGLNLILDKMTSR
jgi:hypothetical protein